MKIKISLCIFFLIVRIIFPAILRFNTTFHGIVYGSCNKFLKPVYKKHISSANFNQSAFCSDVHTHTHKSCKNAVDQLCTLSPFGTLVWLCQSFLSSKLCR
ncbi:uncharacterized protein LOC107981063 [Nasonia vitripennis]|uniref:Uncharacterized protein n=1 Tax=Nasonia vitripennis TaxID=7425 RepID=A0A7M7IZF4_NASVI|nr:uncharacterized protein LOC107981063 [Nasonia vitripennis]